MEGNHRGPETAAQGKSLIPMTSALADRKQIRADSLQSLWKRFRDECHGCMIDQCIQCGTCSGSCPLAGEMDHGPREIFSLIRDGFVEKALCSSTIWLCVSCYACTARCPREIPVTDIIYGLRQMAVKQGLVSSRERMPHLFRAFARQAGAGRRISEARVAFFYGLRFPGHVLPALPLSLKLLKRKRLEL